MKTQCSNSQRRGARSSSLFVVIGALTCAAVPLPQWSAAATADIIWQTNAQAGSSVSFSPDSTLVASGSYNGSAKLLQAANGAFVREFRIRFDQNDEVRSVAFSPDGTQLAGSNGEDDSRVWDVITGASVWSPIFASLFGGAISYAPDGSLVAFTDVDSVNLRSPADGFPRGALPGPGGLLTSVDFSRDGRWIAAATWNGLARVWSVADRSPFMDFVGPADEVMTAVKFSPDGRLLLSASEGILKFWRVSNGTLVGSFDGETLNSVISVDIAPNGLLFVYGRIDGTVLVARMPLWITDVTEANGEVTIHWQGSSERYQVQARHSLSTGAWQNLGPPTTNTCFSSTCLSPMFYRVQSLPAP